MPIVYEDEGEVYYYCNECDTRVYQEESYCSECNTDIDWMILGEEEYEDLI